MAEPAVADHLAPLLRRAEADGVIAEWWFIRKHPCWRLRLQLGPAGRAMTADLYAALDQLTTGGQISGWWPERLRSGNSRVRRQSRHRVSGSRLWYLGEPQRQRARLDGRAGHPSEMRDQRHARHLVRCRFANSDRCWLSQHRPGDVGLRLATITSQ
ncbi:MAG: thiopeptide-type bacteriocin biosynthesis protein [Pseudonocardiaceae bacterium]